MKLLNKLKSKAGESLVESMASILIFTMASIILFTMVTTAGNINTNAKEKDALNQIELNAVERGEKSYTDALGTTHNIYDGADSIALYMGSSTDGSTFAQIPVDIYRSDPESTDGLFSFFVASPTESGTPSEPPEESTPETSSVVPEAPEVGGGE